MSDHRGGVQHLPGHRQRAHRDDRDTVHAEQVRRMPGFGEYAQKTESIRTIPVLELRRR
jgi:hypothetical protein